MSIQGSHPVEVVSPHLLCHQLTIGMSSVRPSLELLCRADGTNILTRKTFMRIQTKSLTDKASILMSPLLLEQQLEMLHNLVQKKVPRRKNITLLNKVINWEWLTQITDISRIGQASYHQCHSLLEHQKLHLIIIIVNRMDIGIIDLHIILSDFKFLSINVVRNITLILFNIYGPKILPNILCNLHSSF